MKKPFMEIWTKDDFSLQVIHVSLRVICEKASAFEYEEFVMSAYLMVTLKK
jgi:hypothetical protein